jgi:hypothetical protein
MNGLLKPELGQLYCGKITGSLYLVVSIEERKPIGKPDRYLIECIWSEDKAHIGCTYYDIFFSSKSYSLIT